MEKIPTLFVRDPADRARVLPQVTAGCEWALREGVATRKYDGTCMLYDGAAWWARREVRAGKNPPPHFVLVRRDENTGKSFGWEPVAQSSFVRFHREAVGAVDDPDEPDGASWTEGTYELIGPKINGNPERREGHELLLHANAERVSVPDRTFRGCER